MTWRRRVRLLAALAIVAVLGGPRPGAAEDLVTADGVAVPEGFEDYFEPSLTYVDVYFGGRPIGSTTAIYGPGHFQFQEPLEIISRIGEIKDPDLLMRELGGVLDPHEDKVCYSQTQADCGVITPVVAGVIYNADTFRADLFIGPDHLDVLGIDQERYLPEPQDGVAFTSGVRGTFSGGSGQSAQFSGDNESTLAYADGRAVANLIYQQDDALYLDGLRAEQDMQDWRYTAGLFDALGSQFVGEELIYGLAASTMLDRRLDLGRASGTELILFLPQRAQVETIVDGRVLATAFYQAGNQLIDTSSLPDGSYEITFRITDLGGTVTEETRFFSKSQRLPPLDTPLYVLQLGVLAQDLGGDGLHRSVPGLQTDQPVLRLGANHRLSDDFGAALTGIANPDASVIETGGVFIGNGFSVDASALWTTDGDRGLRGGMGGTLLGFNVNVSAQRVWVGEAPRTVTPAEAVFDPVTANRVQASGSLSRDLGWGRFSFLGQWNRDTGASSYSYGPNLQIPLWSGDVDFASLNLSATQSQDRTDAMALFTYAWGNSRSPVRIDVSGGLRYARSNDTGTLADQTGEEGHARLTWREDDVLTRDRLLIGGGVFHDTDEDGIEGSLSYAADGAGGISAAAVRSRDGLGAWSDNYNGNFVAGLIGNTEEIGLTGASVDRSGVLLTLDGNTGDALFDVVIGGQRFGTISAGESRAIPLSPYNTYAVRIEPITGGFITVLEDPQEVTLYPGNVVSVAFHAAEVVPVFGRIVREDGSAVGIARILGSMDAAVTDELGFFQTEMAGPGLLTIQPLSGPECTVEVTSLGDNGVFAKLGTLVCVADGPGAL